MGVRAFICYPHHEAVTQVDISRRVREKEEGVNDGGGGGLWSVSWEGCWDMIQVVHLLNKCFTVQFCS